MTSTAPSEDDVAGLVARATIDTPGVTRLAPGILDRIVSTAARAARHLAGAAVDEDPRADPDAVDIDDPGDGTPPTLTVRFVVADDPPVLRTVEAVATAVSAALDAVPYPAVLSLQVVDIDASWSSGST